MRFHTYPSPRNRKNAQGLPTYNIYNIRPNGYFVRMSESVRGFLWDKTKKGVENTQLSLQKCIKMMKTLHIVPTGRTIVVQMHKKPAGG